MRIKSVSIRFAREETKTKKTPSVSRRGESSVALSLSLGLEFVGFRVFKILPIKKNSPLTPPFLCATFTERRKMATQRRTVVTLRQQREPMQLPNVSISNLAAKKQEEKKDVKFGDVMKKASQKAFRGGVAGFAAGVIQVGSFMWMRTTMNYQYANGGTLGNALKTLYKEGGIPRFYRGLPYAIIQNPLSRFGDTAANTGILAALEAFYPQMPVPVMTGFASAGGASWRIFLTPVDTFKTTLQVQGSGALELLKNKVKQGGVGVLYSGAAANFAANWVGNYPWFATFNYLQANVPKMDGTSGLARNAAIGATASIVSDCVSNSLRVVKTVKQTNADASLGYIDVVKQVIAKDGVKGLFGRGLQTRMLTNVMQSMVFSVFWKAIEKSLNERAAAKANAKKSSKKTASYTMAHADAFGLPPLMKRSVARDCEASNGLIIA